MLRKSPTRTEAFLAANRRNALKSTGPRTARGKAWSCMNNLKHGRYAKRLPEKLETAGNREGAALYQKIRGEIGTAFQARLDDPGQAEQLDRFTTTVWLLARSAGIHGLKPRSDIFSRKLGPRHQRRLLFRMEDRRRGVRISYWVQRKGYWTPERRLMVSAGKCPADAPTLGEILEGKLRHRVFRLGSPNRLEQWERLFLALGGRRALDECGKPASPDTRITNEEQSTRNGNLAGFDGVGPGLIAGNAVATRMPETPGATRPQQDEAPLGLGRAAETDNPSRVGGLRDILARLLRKIIGVNGS